MRVYRCVERITDSLLAQLALSPEDQRVGVTCTEICRLQVLGIYENFSPGLSGAACNSDKCAAFAFTLAADESGVGVIRRASV